MSGNWWTATQYSDTNAVKLNGGSFNNNNKNNSNTCMALFRTLL